MVRLHTGTVYRVYMLGFLPGFAYMGSVDPRIAMPRLEHAARCASPPARLASRAPRPGSTPATRPAAGASSAAREVHVFDAARAESFLC